MNTSMYNSAEREELAKGIFASGKGGSLNDFFLDREARYHEASEQIIAETEMIWTMVNV